MYRHMNSTCMVFNPQQGSPFWFPIDHLDVASIPGRHQFKPLKGNSNHNALDSAIWSRQEGSTLLQLPGEVRNIIYEYVFFNQTWIFERHPQAYTSSTILPAVSWNMQRALKLIQACHQIHAEAHLLAFSNSTIYASVTDAEPFYTWLLSLSNAQRNAIRRIEFGCPIKIASVTNGPCSDPDKPYWRASLDKGFIGTASMLLQSSIQFRSEQVVLTFILDMRDFFLGRDFTPYGPDIEGDMLLELTETECAFPNTTFMAGYRILRGYVPTFSLYSAMDPRNLSSSLEEWQELKV